MVALNVDVWDASGRVTCRHVFYARTEAEARRNFEAHLEGDQDLADAEEDNRIGEFTENITADEVPSSDDYAEDAESFEPPEPEEDVVEIEAEPVED